ncbi:uncharacterized protein LOC115099312 [Rhinatrema bivittatum]|uniref:uncharacterized protein LOC115099312 n=1 Tax=Rhinatrema bivittatum TaxID=194408 RepID=UPI00112AF076|nr:uncharacterized protein LOC115099312 [Rhinatrema bivittatum]
MDYMNVPAVDLDESKLTWEKQDSCVFVGSLLLLYCVCTLLHHAYLQISKYFHNAVKGKQKIRVSVPGSEAPAVLKKCGKCNPGSYVHKLLMRRQKTEIPTSHPMETASPSGSQSSRRRKRRLRSRRALQSIWHGGSTTDVDLQESDSGSSPGTESETEPVSSAVSPRRRKRAWKRNSMRGGRRKVLPCPPYKTRAVGPGEWLPRGPVQVGQGPQGRRRNSEGSSSSET